MFVDVGLYVFETQIFQIANEKIQHHLDWLPTTPSIDYGPGNLRLPAIPTFCVMRWLGIAKRSNITVTPTLLNIDILESAYKRILHRSDNFAHNNQGLTTSPSRRN
jgi:hypothetical protein